MDAGHIFLCREAKMQKYTGLQPLNGGALGRGGGHTSTTFTVRLALTMH